MKIGKRLHFSQNYSYLKVNWDERECLIKAFKDRVETFYIQPAELLSKNELGFAVGILCITTIDFLSKFKFDDGKRLVKWIKEYIDDFNQPNPDNSNQTYADRFYDEFRDGLIHEGRIKNAGQFSYECQEIVKVKEGVMEVNPKKLLSVIKNFFSNFITQIKEDDEKFLQFENSLKNDFAKEIDLVRKDSEVQ